MSGFDADTALERDCAVALARVTTSDYNPKFADWLLTHYGIYCRFEEAGHRVKARGIKEYSAFVIVNVLRYRADTEGSKFSMTNTFVPDLARLYNQLHGPLFKISGRAKKPPEESHE